MSVESTLLVVREVQVFQLPPRQTSKGYKASEWDPSQIMWTGRLKVVAIGNDCMIRLEDAQQNSTQFHIKTLHDEKVFAQCNYDGTAKTVEPVLDSSRYFVLRVEDAATQRYAFLGLGFPERNDAFDFNVALQDHIKVVNRQQEIQKQPAEEGPRKDYTLKQTISINIGNIGKKQTGVVSNADSGNASFATTSQAATSTSQADDPFGDFTSAPVSISNSNGATSGGWVEF